MAYPTTIDSFTNPNGTNTQDNPDHALQHTNVNGAVNAIETAVGTTAGTGLMNAFTATDRPVRRNTGGTILDTLSLGTINNTILGTPAITGGSVNNTVVGTPAMTGGTANSITLGTPTLQGAVVNTANIVDAAVTSRKVQLQYAGTLLGGANFTQTTSSTTWYDVTNLFVVINPAVTSVIDITMDAIEFSSAGSGRIDTQLLYNGASLVSSLHTAFSTVERNVTNMTYIGTVGSGLGTIKVQVSDQGGGNNTVTVVASNYAALNVKYWSV